MPGVYPNYTAQTLSTEYDIPDRLDIFNGAYWNAHDALLIAMQSVLSNLQGSSVAEAPLDGNVYARQNGKWIIIVSLNQIDAGNAESVYLLFQEIDCGNASSIYTASQLIDGGDS